MFFSRRRISFGANKVGTFAKNNDATPAAPPCGRADEIDSGTRHVATPAVADVKVEDATGF